MTLAPMALQADWLGLCRRAVSGLQELLAATPTTALRVQETGTRGSGGDRTLVIDSDAEAVVLAELDALRTQGYRFQAISEERGEIDYGDAQVRVIIDPIDGSLNAKRGVPHYSLSIAVADGDTMADVAFGFVHDFGVSEQWWASRGEGAWCNGERLDRSLPERRWHDGKLELLGIESADPRWVADAIDPLVDTAHGLRRDRLDPGPEDRRLRGRQDRCQSAPGRSRGAGGRVRAAGERIHRAVSRQAAAATGRNRTRRVDRHQYQGDAGPARSCAQTS